MVISIHVLYIYTHGFVCVIVCEYRHSRKSICVIVRMFVKNTIYIYICICIHTHTVASGRAGGRGSDGDRAPRGSAVLADADVFHCALSSATI